MNVCADKNRCAWPRSHRGDRFERFRTSKQTGRNQPTADLARLRAASLVRSLALRRLTTCDSALSRVDGGRPNDFNCLCRMPETRTVGCPQQFGQCRALVWPGSAPLSGPSHAGLCGIGNRDFRTALILSWVASGAQLTMSSYKVMPRRRDSGFKVEVITVDGIRHTLLGFETELEAVIWAEADKERERTWVTMSSGATG
jgi:hypothetical protein